MMVLLVIVLVMLAAAVGMLAVLLFRRGSSDSSDVLKKMEFIEKELKQIEAAVKDEISRNRTELSGSLQS